MEVILTKVSKLGNIGDRVSVKGGYARNYLIPTGGAVSTTPRNVAYFEKIKSELEAKAAEELKAAQKLAKLLEKLELTITAKVSEGDAIFGSITVSDVVALIQEDFPEVTRKQVHLLEGPAKQLGSFDVTIQCHRDVVVPLQLTIEAEASKDDA